MLFHGLALAVVGFYKNATVAHRRLGLGESIQLHQPSLLSMFTITAMKFS
jgi:hypothetical protein